MFSVDTFLKSISDLGFVEPVDGCLPDMEETVVCLFSFSFLSLPLSLLILHFLSVGV